LGRHLNQEYKVAARGTYGIFDAKNMTRDYKRRKLHKQGEGIGEGKGNTGENTSLWASVGGGGADFEGRGRERGFTTKSVEKLQRPPFLTRRSGVPIGSAPAFDGRKGRGP